MASGPELNPKIAKTGSGEYELHIACRNIANAARDEDGAALPWDPTGEKLKSPLCDRLTYLIDDINGNKPDALFLLEAGRPSGGMSWTKMAADIEEKTGLTYMGLAYVNASRLPFAKALFVNRRTTAVRQFDQLWVSDTPSIPSGDHFGTDVLRVTLSPVENGVVVVDRRVTCVALHAPMALPSRLDFASWVSKHHNIGDLFFGDCNTFPDDGGPSMIERMTEHLRDITPPVTSTFRAFPQDVLAVHPSRRGEFGPPNLIVHETTDTLYVSPSSVLDRCFASTSIVAKVDVHRHTPASDHAAISIWVTL